MNHKETYWREEAPKYHWPHVRLKLIAQAIRANPSILSVLDAGAGSGTLAGLLDRNVRYMGLDITGQAEPGDRAPFIRYCDFDDLDSLPGVMGGQYDALVISGVLEYLRDWRGSLRAMLKNALRPGGMLLVSAIYFPFYKTFPIRPHPAWINQFTPAGIHAALAENGLKLEVTYPMWTGGYPWTAVLSRAFSLRGLSLPPKWIHWMGVNQFLYIAHREA